MKPASDTPVQPKIVQAAPRFVSDEELEEVVRGGIRRAVLGELKEAALLTELRFSPGKSERLELNDGLQREIAARLQKMGLRLARPEMSKHPSICLRVTLIRPIGAPGGVSYNLELAIMERVELKRPHPTYPPVQTYTLNSSGKFRLATIDTELRVACNKLLDSFQKQLQTAKAPSESP
jgi:hypothetical protein